MPDNIINSGTKLRMACIKKNTRHFFMYLFSYGSNMTTIRLEGRGIKPVAIAGAGFLDNWSISFNKASKKNPEMGFANISPFWGSRVFGVIFGIKDEDLLRLDKFEGYPTHYQRTVLRVNWAPDPSAVYDCITYIASPEWTATRSLRVSEEYAGHVMRGLNEHVHKYSPEYVRSVNEMIDNVL
jgi:gamma-glutamylcyclotransferase